MCFFLLSLNQSPFLKEGGYAHYDSGVPVDYELPSFSWYDLAKLDGFLEWL